MGPTGKPKRTFKSLLKQVWNHKINKETPNPGIYHKIPPSRFASAILHMFGRFVFQVWKSLCLSCDIKPAYDEAWPRPQWWKNHRHGPPGLPYGPSWCLLKALLRFARASKFWFVTTNQKWLLLRRCHISVKSSWIYPSIVLRCFSKICTATEWELRNEPGESHWKLLETQKRGSRLGAVHIYEKPS